MALDKNTYFAILKLSINKDIKLPKDSGAAVTTSGFLGSKFIAITPGSEETNLSDNDQIKYTQSSINIESLIGKLMYSQGNK
jgi:phospholipid/cholesterol/gamma-HCH transport system substrate-binding protein